MDLIEASLENIEEILNQKFNRPSINDPKIVKIVQKIIDEVVAEGDAALFRQVKKLDGAKLESLKVARKEISEAYSKIEPDFIKSLKIAIDRIRSFHEKEKPEAWRIEEDGLVVGEVVRPLESVGCYVPGGNAAYPSSALMTVIPAVVAGVERIIICTPCDKKGAVNPYTLVAAKEAGCTEIYKLGGASAVAAMAHGTETVPKVVKIVGPGNIYVTAAKKAVYGEVGIDGLAGPSEVVVIADSSASPKFIALDMLAQAEHGSGATAILITTDRYKGYQAIKYIKEAVEDTGNFLFIVARNLEEAFQMSNFIAPEHIELMVENQDEWLKEVRNAGAILLGNYTPAAFGDYIAGPNHVLPTGGAAAYQSALGTRDFMKYISLLSSDKDGIAKLSSDIAAIATREGLQAHADSATERT